jgi:hypothetical protein
MVSGSYCSAGFDCHATSYSASCMYAYEQYQGSLLLETFYGKAVPAGCGITKESGVTPDTLVVRKYSPSQVLVHAFCNLQASALYEGAAKGRVSRELLRSGVAWSLWPWGSHSSSPIVTSWPITLALLDRQGHLPYVLRHNSKTNKQYEQTSRQGSACQTQHVLLATLRWQTATGVARMLCSCIRIQSCIEITSAAQSFWL